MDLIKEIIQIIPSRDIRKFYKTALPTWSKQQMITIIHNFADYADCVRLYKAVRQGCRDEILLDYIDRTLALLEAEGHRNDPKIEGEYRSLPSYSVCNPPVLFGIGDEVQYYRFVAGKEQTELTIGKVTKLPPSRRESFFDEFYEVKTEENTVENVSIFEVEKRSRAYCLKSVVQECRKNGIDRYFCVGSNNQERTFTYRQGDYRIHDGQTQKVISTQTQLLFKVAHDRFMKEVTSAINGNGGFIPSTVLDTKIAYKKTEDRAVYDFVVMSPSDIFMDRQTVYGFLYRLGKDFFGEDRTEEIIEEIKSGDLPFLKSAKEQQDTYLACAIKEFTKTISREEADYLSSIDKKARFIGERIPNTAEFKVLSIEKGLKSFFHRSLYFYVEVMIDGRNYSAQWYPEAKNRLHILSYPETKMISIGTEVERILQEKAEAISQTSSNGNVE